MLSGDFYYGLPYQDFWDFPCIFQDFYYGPSCHCHFGNSQPLPFWQGHQKSQSAIGALCAKMRAPSVR